ncbi:type II toxin-antitoxin system RelE/ParE family toxin [Niabella aquatica]
MPFEIIPAPSFLKELKAIAKKYPSIKDDVNQLSQKLKKDPQTGTPIGKDCYKIRLAITSKGKGKSGSARVITCVKIIRRTVYLLGIYDKADIENISDAELRNRINEIS